MTATKSEVITKKKKNDFAKIAEEVDSLSRSVGFSGDDDIQEIWDEIY